MNNLMAIPYAKGRDSIQDGDVVFVAHKKGIFIPQLIEFSTKSIFSHVAIAFWVETNGVKRLLAVQQQGGNKRFVMNLSALDKCQLYVVTPPKSWASVASTALAKLDQVKYGYLEALYVGVREFLMTRFNITLPEKDFTGEICSEFVAMMEGCSDVYISPQALYEELMKTQQVRFVLSNP
jgi:hypothetical protein